MIFYRAVDRAWEAADAQDLQPPSRVLVLLAVARYVKDTPVYPSYATVAGHAHMSEVQVKAHIHALVADGYLTQTRRKPTQPGWGAPQWELGPRCQDQTSGQPDILPARHLASQTQTSGTPDIQTSGVPAQKRESSTTAAAVGVSNGGGGTAAVVKRFDEEKDHPPPPPPAAPVKDKPVGNPRVKAFIDGVRDGGGKHALEGTLTGQDLRFLKEGDFDPAALGACYRATFDGTWAGADPWIKARMSLSNVHKYRFTTWLAQGTPTAAPASVTGRPSRIQAQRDRIERMRVREEAHEVRGVRPALPAPGNALRG